MRCCLLSLVLLAVPAATRAQQPPEAARVDSIFSAYTATTPGCAVGAVGPNVRLEKAYGLADLERGVPFTTATISEAGSVSKQFVAAAVLKLAEQGKLSLDDPIRKYIPELAGLGRPITIRQLLSHTSGLRDWGAMAGLQGWPRGTRAYTNDDVLDILAAQRTLNFEPGTEWSYSNSGYNLSAILVQRVSGRSLAEYTREALFEPLGMTHTSWRDDYRRVVPGRALAYGSEEGAYRTDMPNESAYGNGGLLTTVGDLLTWNAALDSGRVLGRTIVSQMETEGILTGGKPTGYGLGLFIGRWNGEREIGHGGATAGYRSVLARYPDRGVSIAILCNVGSANPTELGRRVAALLRPAGAVRQATSSGAAGAGRRPRISLPHPALERLAGMYRNRASMQPYEIRVADSVLLLRGTRMEPISPTEFRNASGGDPRLVFSGRDGRPLVLGIMGRDTMHLDPVAATQPSDTTPAALAAYLGPWHSDEAAATVRITLENGRLMARWRRALAFPLEPIYADAFRAPDGTVLVFHRDAGGKVVGVGVWQDRARDVRFERGE